ncbi:N-acetyl-gamma-glutamyl-phosphate reductase [Elusimicrobiota bacterium]
MVNIAIVGITGYAGEELLKILSVHKKANLTVLMGRSFNETKPLKELYPDFSHINLSCESLNIETLTKRADLIFLALPHRVSFEVVPDIIQAGGKVIDLSADFRINNGEIYEQWYGSKHSATHLLTEAVYGMPEIYRDKIKKAKLVANPGCYPTTVILGCTPVLKKGLVDVNTIIVDAKSAVTGAGRKAVAEYYNKEHPNFRPYNIGGSHRHIPEMEQELEKVVNKKIKLTFTPHIMPAERGMLSTIYMNLNKEASTKKVLDIYFEFYKNEKFVRILPEGQLPSIHKVVNTNYCDIGVKIDERTKKLIIISAIDNLVKGASGQAVQNMNIMYGFNEEEGLKR